MEVKKQAKSNSRSDKMKPHLKHQCKECNKTFCQAANLRRHTRIHTGEKPFSCAKCDKKFADSSSLTWHLITHAEKRNFKCKKCNKEFYLENHLKRHEAIHLEKTNKFECGVCGKVLKRLDSFRYHTKTHNSTAKPFKCNSCDKVLFNQELLEKHKELHQQHNEKKNGEFIKNKMENCISIKLSEECSLSNETHDFLCSKEKSSCYLSHSSQGSIEETCKISCSSQLTLNSFLDNKKYLSDNVFYSYETCDKSKPTATEFSSMNISSLTTSPKNNLKTLPSHLTDRSQQELIQLWKDFECVSKDYRELFSNVPELIFIQKSDVPYASLFNTSCQTIFCQICHALVANEDEKQTHSCL